MEEQEAKRLQLKARDALDDVDFGLGDSIEGGTLEPETVDLLEPTEAFAVQPLPKDREALIKHIERTNPETLALARDWDDIAHALVKAQAKIAAVETEQPDALSLGMLHLHYQTLLTYATTLAFYLHLGASEKYAQRPELLRSHPIISRLLTLKQSLSTLEELDFAASDDDEDDLDVDLDELESDDLDDSSMTGLDRKALREFGVELAELQELLKEAGNGEQQVVETKQEPQRPSPKKSKKKSKETTLASNGVDEPPKKKRRTSASSSSSLPIFDLEEPTFPSTSSLKPSKSSSTKSKPSASIQDTLDPYGEPISLQSSDLQDKASRQRSLRFHTARIESTSQRREKARDRSGGGDDDIPWKDRKKGKEEKQKKELLKQGRGAGGDDLDGEDPEPRASNRSMDGSGSEEEGEEGYYELVKRKTKERKEKKKTDYDDAQAASRVVEDESADGPRSLTRAILKNKGLTPSRSKSIRNPRVKKRMRFEKAKKKVSSQRAVYKGGIGESGRYDGEKSGISKVIKSTRL